MATEDQIVNYIKSLPEQQWYSLEDIGKGMNIPYSEIQRLVTESEAFVTSIGDKNETVITLRATFRKNEPVYRKIIGAFKNRID
ncbi:hypothetical protein [Mucilaginibacter sp. L3T2-6]|uniref:hypothetical protein n=1 Tax=Mucilaginibacter sp. L3T2-6 TaxID=3062491 RepID=UPI002674A8FF|nr:hypothetical protein [Mucilaginibacter sp. L3T2-6]MDO3641504.1 hypothetical protein [Mucilaginibacter sp. L3T2-6]MDV6213735.1 hypothetical protein [Mucilaginibacter sp. L3T2-6]